MGSICGEHVKAEGRFGEAMGKQKQKERDRNSEEKREEGGTGSGNKIEQVYTIRERFIRLSALAAAELESWEGG